MGHEFAVFAVLAAHVQTAQHHGFGTRRPLLRIFPATCRRHRRRRGIDRLPFRLARPRRSTTSTVSTIFSSWLPVPLPQCIEKVHSVFARQTPRNASERVTQLNSANFLPGTPHDPHGRSESCWRTIPITLGDAMKISRCASFRCATPHRDATVPRTSIPLRTSSGSSIRSARRVSVSSPRSRLGDPMSSLQRLMR